MKREFLINIGFLLLINLLIKPVFVFFIDSRAQDVLGTDVYGQYFALFNLSYILTIFTDLGIQNYNSRTIAQNKELLPEYLPNIMSLKILLSCIVLIAGMLITLMLGYKTGAIIIFTLILINQIMLSFILYLRSNISATGKYRWDSMVSVIDKVILIAILGVILYSSLKDNFSIYQYIFSQTAALFVVFCIVMIINFNLIKKISIRFDLVFFRKILKSSLPYSLVIIMMAIYMRIDGFLLERMLPTPDEAGIYAAAYRIFDALNNLGYLFAVLLLPMFASLLSKRDKLIHLISTSHDLLLFISATASVLTIIYSKEIMRLLYPSGYTDYYSSVLIFLMLSFFSVCMNYIYGTLLTSAGRISSINKIVFGAVILNVLLNLLLIPANGALGAAITSVITQYFVFLLQYILSLGYIKAGFNKYIFFKRITYILLLIFLTFSLKNFINLNWIILAIISAFLSLILAYLWGFIKLSDLKRT
ncbi:MAG: oligosaccharide flippase family protein [Saprospiraceae bacterium]|nr:oligosaccharide flippase family protein [Saprospiraceae bacterium]